MAARSERERERAMFDVSKRVQPVPAIFRRAGKYFRFRRKSPSYPRELAPISSPPAPPAPPACTRYCRMHSQLQRMPPPPKCSLKYTRELERHGVRWAARADSRRLGARFLAPRFFCSWGDPRSFGRGVRRFDCALAILIFLKGLGTGLGLTLEYAVVCLEFEDCD